MICTMLIRCDGDMSVEDILT